MADQIKYCGIGRVPAIMGVVSGLGALCVEGASECRVEG